MVTDGEPSTFEITLEGLAGAGSDGQEIGGEPLDAGGFRLEQTGGPASLTVPEGTVLEPGSFLVIGRAANRDEFEAFWGELDEQVIYIDGRTLVGDPGFPLINGGERYRLLDASGAQVDPPAGTVPGRRHPTRTCIPARDDRQRDFLDSRRSYP